ncbi:Cysteine proteinase 3 [Entamoeba marina]
MFALILSLSVLSNALDFHQWAAKHGKHFSASETLRRSAIFNNNARVVAFHNKHNKFQLSLDGPFAAMTNKEYQKTLHPYKQDTTLQVASFKGAIPESIDWREKGKVPAIRDQGQCGSCYSFSSLAAYETRLLIAGSKFTADTIDLSEQQIVDCSTYVGNKGCDGGNVGYTIYYLMKDGVMEESDYEYQAVQGTCSYDSSKVVAKSTGGRSTHSGDEDDLIAAIAEGTVATAIDASNISFQLYKSGVYDEPKCSSTSLNHGVAAVGYGNLDGDDYYIVRNSWGSSWGDEGYILMSRNKNNQCGISTRAFIPTGLQDA